MRDERTQKEKDELNELVKIRLSNFIAGALEKLYPSAREGVISDLDWAMNNFDLADYDSMVDEASVKYFVG